MGPTARFILCEIEEADIEIKPAERTGVSNYQLRKASRGLLLKGDKVALLNVSTKKYHKLPGGGLERGETPEEAFKREVKEETGWDCEILEKNPVTIEYRNRIKVLQISYIFVARAVGKPSGQQLEEGEIQDGHDLEWVPIKQVEELLSDENPSGYEDKFIRLRDLTIFRHYMDRLKELGN